MKRFFCILVMAVTMVFVAACGRKEETAAGSGQENITVPGQTEEALEPDFDYHNDIEIDMDQLHEDTEDIALNKDDYPMGADLDFDLDIDAGTADVRVAVKDGTSAEDAAFFASEVLKIINDNVCVQDFTYGESDDTTFGGLYQDTEVELAVYYESEYPDGEPFYTVTVPMDTYMEFDIEQ